MSLEEEQRNKEIVTAFVKATNKLELDKLDDMVVEDYVEHQPIPGQPPGREGLKWAYKVFNEPFPDLEFDFADVIAEGDLVVGRGIGEAVNKGSFMGIPPTNKPVKWSGTRLFRMKDGKLVEGWINIDMLGMMQQLGVVPTPPPGPPGSGDPAHHRGAVHARGEPRADGAVHRGGLEQGQPRRRRRDLPSRRRRARARRPCRSVPRA